MEHKVESFEIAGRIEMLVGWNQVITKHPFRYEECHSVHIFTEDDIKVDLTSVEIVIGSSKGVDILPLLNKKQKQEIIDNLPL